MKKTLENLVVAFLGECQARNKYTFYAKIAKKEGYEQIAEVFLLTAENEKEHAESLFELINKLKEKLNIDAVEVKVKVKLQIGNTVENLKAAIEEEKYVHSKMYPEFAKIAREEELRDIAIRLEAIAIAEKHHEERFRKILKEIENDTLFNKSEKVWWVCRKCGYIHFGKTPPEKCPSCEHSKNYFQVMCEEY